MQDLKAKFDDYYNHHLLGKFMEMEAERHKQMDVFIKRLLLTGIFIPLLILLFWSSFWGDYIAGSRNLTELTVYVLAGYVFISLFYCRSPIVSFKIDVKEEVMAKFAAFWGDFIYAYGRSCRIPHLKTPAFFRCMIPRKATTFSAAIIIRCKPLFPRNSFIKKYGQRTVHITLPCFRELLFCWK